MSDNSDYDRPIPGKRLKEALRKATAVLGRSAQDAMFNDLELCGITFMDRPYSFKELHDALVRVFGHDGTALLMERLKRTINSAQHETDK